jgi:hypothetical protein
MSDICISPEPNASIKKTESDEFLTHHKLNLFHPDDVTRFLIYQLEKRAPKIFESPPPEPSPSQNCLEHRLDRRQTSYSLDEVDDITVLLGVSGAGKTRQVLELLNARFGYYFVCGPDGSIGSADLSTCMMFCERSPANCKFYIRLLYFVRAFVCNHLIELGYNYQLHILNAQLHPNAFFGCDVFDDIFHSLARLSVEVNMGSFKPFDFVVIDEIQLSVERDLKFVISQEATPRPFFSPLVYYSKLIETFPAFIVSGTGINFELIQRMLTSTTLKKSNIGSKVVSTLNPLSKDQIECYSRQILSDHGFPQDKIEEFVSVVSTFDLCHGRARFIANILDCFITTHDLEYAIGRFVLGVSRVSSPWFPLKFLSRDFEQYGDEGNLRMIGKDSLHTIITNALIDFLMTGKATIRVKGTDASKAISYGLGFGSVVEGTIECVYLIEAAVVEGLRQFVSLSEVVDRMVMEFQRYRNAQMVGYMLEFFVGFALVANMNPKVSEGINVFRGTFSEYLEVDSHNELYFPDHCCGPDVVYKYEGIVYIVQVKFVNTISKQERINACHTTNPEYFYWNKKKDIARPEFRDSRRKIRALLQNLPQQQIVVLHTKTKTTSFMEEVDVYSSSSYPDFFDKIFPGMWGILDDLRERFESQA